MREYHHTKPLIAIAYPVFNRAWTPKRGPLGLGARPKPRQCPFVLLIHKDGNPQFSGFPTRNYSLDAEIIAKGIMR